jgi:hypothetical protein
MPEFEPVEQINISTSVAKWLMETCVSLIRHYSARDFDPAVGRFSERTPGLTALEDRIPLEDQELKYWTGTVINLVTTIAGILHNAITANNLLRLGHILPIDDENNDPFIGEI